MEELRTVETAAAGTGTLPAGGRRKKRRGWKWLAAAAVLAGAALAAVKLLGGGQTAPAGESYRPVQVIRRDMAVSVTGTATLEPADAYDVTALVSGEILEAPFEEFSRVEKGELLYAIDDSAVRDSVSGAAIGVAQAELSYRQATEARTPKAPISGVIAETCVKDGQTVTAGQMIARIMASTDVTADFLFTYVSPDAFFVGQSATVFIDGLAGSVQGTVAAVSDDSTVTSTGRQACTVRVKIANPGSLTDSGSYTAQAVIGSYTSYGQTRLAMTGSAAVTAAASGTVSGFRKPAGSTVTAGEALCTLVSGDIDDAIRTAQLSLQRAKLTQSTAEDSADGYRIIAPISGTVIQKNFKAGDKVDGVSSGTLAVVYDLSCLKADMAVNELDIGKVRVGQEVEITADALPGQTFTGVVEKVSIAGSTTNGFTTYPVTIRVEDYGDMRPGMNVSARIIGDGVRDALCVPSGAVRRGDTVLLPGPDTPAAGENGLVTAPASALEERVVTIGAADAAYVQILDGLGEGDTVLLPVSPETEQTGGTDSGASD
ncbi:efflux RND transporter periplasmic adaptor subunit [Dysosmobacter sp.]|uniref:efflux RND transporter periplasmic adaptor subunit n=1 Tax=Dysosmobacter sp. TaxID=2591382 RepID=UPI002A8FC591|nr:efflux RND transporter periplasmic adaptor subunit [Dysosmobacter sp.]MDY3281550.1 efflux RND transporter periplasmic adaptor subunit [Dysosmobacter sp.]